MTEAELVTTMKKAFVEKLPIANDIIQFDNGAMRAALRIAIPWVREQTLREAAEAVGSVLDRRQQLDAIAAILALIPARPSQTETP